MMRLSQLLPTEIDLTLVKDVDVLRLVLDSRLVRAGDLFFAVKGSASDGKQFIPAALAQGAAAILVDAESDDDVARMHEGVPIIPIWQLKNKLGFIAARFFGEPAKQLRMIGVTGTNGKTSCTNFMAQILDEPCAVIGTLGSGIYGHLVETGLTTPDAVSLQSSLHDFVEQGAKMVAMEVSSHSIDQGRINGIDFEIGVFTNLTQDHLDYHHTMEAYAAVKRSFIAGPATQHVIINADDPYGRQWLDELAGHKSVFAYGCDLTADDLARIKVPVVYADQIELSLEGFRAMVHTPWGEASLKVPLIGRFNLSNVLAVLTTMCFYGVPFERVLARIAKLQSVPGRMQAVAERGKPLVVVDYSHTPDALEKALQALRHHTQGNLVCVFGCGGDRDATKRPLMARIAEKLADRVIVTNDNPRHERPEAIAEQIMQGFLHPDRVSLVLDRSKAIENGIQYANASDCILVAGKGAERYQQLGDEKIHFDDVEEVKKYLS